MHSLPSSSSPPSSLPAAPDGMPEGVCRLVVDFSVTPTYESVVRALVDRPQTYFDGTIPLEAFAQTPMFQRTLEEVGAGIFRLEFLLGGNPRWVCLRDAFNELTARHTGNAPDQAKAQCSFLGEGKRALRALCDCLEATGAPPAMVDRVLRALETDLLPGGGALPDVTAALGRALEAAQDRSSPQRPAGLPGPHLRLPAPQKPTAAPVSLASRATGPASFSAAAFASQAKQRWIRSIREQRHFANLPGLTAPAFQGGSDFPEARLELFCTFMWLRTLLLGEGDVAHVRGVIDDLARRLKDQEGPLTRDDFELYGNGKRDLLLLCEALHRDPRPGTVAAACRELRLAFDGSGDICVTPAGAIAEALSAVEVEGAASARSRLDQRLVNGVDRLAALACHCGLTPKDSMEKFLARFLGAKPHGGQNDPVGNLHLFGLDMLESVLASMLEVVLDPDGAGAGVSPTLDWLVDELGRSNDPTGAILSARHRLSTVLAPGLPQDLADRIRGDVVDDAVRRQGLALLPDLPEDDRERLLQCEAMAVKDQLGIDYIVGGIDRGPSTSGLFDTSSSRLLTLLEACDRAVEEALRRRGA